MNELIISFVPYLDTEHMRTRTCQFWRQVHVIINVILCLHWVGHITSVGYRSLYHSACLASSFNTKLKGKKGVSQRLRAKCTCTVNSYVFVGRTNAVWTKTLIQCSAMIFLKHAVEHARKDDNVTRPESKTCCINIMRNDGLSTVLKISWRSVEEHPPVVLMERPWCWQ